jgi:hypothetical protein
MFYQKTKPYYVQNTITNQNSPMLVAFTNEGIKLLDLYAKKCMNDYLTEVVTNFRKLKTTYPNYENDNSIKFITSFVDNVYNLIIINDTLEDEIELLKNHCMEYTNINKIMITDSENIKQSADIKLVYLQYLLLYDLSLTNGVFVDKFLTEAETILNRNGGVLFHPDKPINCDCDCDDDNA